MKSQPGETQASATRKESREVFDLETFLDRMHAQETTARSAHDVFQSRRSNVLLYQEDWTKAECKLVDKYWRKRAA